MVAHICNLICKGYTGRRVWIQGQPRQKMQDPISKIIKAKRAGEELQLLLTNSG
jgi:hypothetical protein